MMIRDSEELFEYRISARSSVEASKGMTMDKARVVPTNWPS